MVAAQHYTGFQKVLVGFLVSAFSPLAGLMATVLNTQQVPQALHTVTPTL